MNIEFITNIHMLMIDLWANESIRTNISLRTTYQIYIVYHIYTATVSERCIISETR